MSAVTVLSPGLQTTVQDLGRWGHQSDGVPVAGAMDLFAHRAANALVGNRRAAATLEVTLAGPALQFEDQRQVAVTGAEFELYLNGSVVSAARIVADPGATLRFGARRAGARAYLAVGGGFDVAEVLGSRATHLPSGMGGVGGRALRRGDRLLLGPTRVSHNPAGRASEAMTASLPWLSEAQRRTTAAVFEGGEAPVVRLLAGPQLERFTADALHDLTAEPYVVSVDSNRMAYRLHGRPIRHRTSADIISDATPAGSIQVPSSGQPMMLMADRQTTGGYAVLATVITADLGVAAQVAPGGALQFRVCERAEAIAALIKREQELLALEDAAG